MTPSLDQTPAPAEFEGVLQMYFILKNMRKMHMKMATKKSGCTIPRIHLLKIHIFRFSPNFPPHSPPLPNLNKCACPIPSPNFQLLLLLQPLTPFLVFPWPFPLILPHIFSPSFLPHNQSYAQTHKHVLPIFIITNQSTNQPVDQSVGCLDFSDGTRMRMDGIASCTHGKVKRAFRGFWSSILLFLLFFILGIQILKNSFKFQSQLNSVID